MDAKKRNKMSIKDFIKDTSPGSRLQSLRLPRDLSLGGTKVAKKVYKPNLNAVRNKNKIRDSLRGANKRTNDKHKFQDKQKQRFVQSSGVFSEGVGAEVVKLPEKRRQGKECEKPPPVLKDPWVVPKKPETKTFERIVQLDDDSDSDKDEKLPFAPISWCLSELLDSVKSEVKPTFADTDVEQPSILPLEYTDDRNRTSPTVTLWQLPDSFAFKKPDNGKSKKFLDCKLTDLPEGRIGKICVRKSGKMDVYIGSFKYELESAEFDSFTEEFVCLDASCPQEGTATVLGKIESRFILNPHWKTLLG